MLIKVKNSCHQSLPCFDPTRHARFGGSIRSCNTLLTQEAEDVTSCRVATPGVLGFSHKLGREKRPGQDLPSCVSRRSASVDGLEGDLTSCTFGHKGSNSAFWESDGTECKACMCFQNLRYSDVMIAYVPGNSSHDAEVAGHPWSSKPLVPCVRTRIG